MGDVYRQHREEIDRIDAELLRLLNRRAAVALEIGRLKREQGEPIHVPEREEAVLNRLAGLNGGPLPERAVRAIFRGVIEQVRRLEADHNP